MCSQPRLSRYYVPVVARRPSALARHTGAGVFVCARHELNPRVVEDAHRHGLAVYVYTLDSAAEVRKVIAMGVDGILSNSADDVVPLVAGAHAVQHPTIVQR